MKILAVDDDPTFLSLLTAVLASAGFKDITAVTSAPEAAQTIVDAHPPFDCCFIDMRMPEIEGDYLCRWIRRLPEYRDTAILMITATSEKEDVENAFLAGASDYMSKPIDLPELISRARQFARDLGKKPAGGKKAAVVEQPATTQAAFSDPVKIEGVRRSLKLTAMENYLLQLSRSEATDLAAVAFRVPDAASLHLRCALEDFSRILTITAKAILAHVKLPHPFISYAGYGVFVIVADAAELGDDDREAIEGAINADLAAVQLAPEGGTPFSLRVDMMEPQKLGSRTGQQMADALYHTIVRAETAPLRARITAP
ncbi:response regulator [Solirhodobacter olei]|uniref:response regulator n=1 Tax=Solirhodobacter olei TaxID=2493082 RepID=UPI000FD808A4|nr:response regulator [Solirhodobacter olei]